MAALAQRHLVVDDVLEFLRGVEPALDGDVFERFVEHDVMLEDLRDPGFDGEVLQRMGIVKVGVQLRLLRAINAAFPSRRRGGGEGAAPLPIREQPRRQRFPTKSSHRRPAAYSDTELAGDARAGTSFDDGKTLLSPTIVSSPAYRRSKLPPPPPGVRPAPVLIETELRGELTQKEKWEERERQRWEEQQGERDVEEGWATPEEPHAPAPEPGSTEAPLYHDHNNGKKKKNKYRPPLHGITLEALESMDANLVPHLLCVLTPSSRPLWGKYAGRLGREILSRVEEALRAAPAGLPDFEVPVIINMLLWESARTSFVSLFRRTPVALGGEEGEDDREVDVLGATTEDVEDCVDTDTLIRCVLPQRGDFTFEWFRSAPDDAIEALVLPFDRKLVAAYAERPSDLVKCLVDAVQVRVREHITIQ